MTTQTYGHLKVDPADAADFKDVARQSGMTVKGAFKVFTRRYVEEFKASQKPRVRRVKASVNSN